MAAGDATAVAGATTIDAAGAAAGATEVVGTAVVGTAVAVVDVAAVGTVVALEAVVGAVVEDMVVEIGTRTMITTAVAGRTATLRAGRSRVVE